MKKVICFILMGFSFILLSQTACAAGDPDWVFDAMDAKKMRSDAPMTIAEEIPPRADGRYYVTDFGANGTDTGDDAEAFLSALLVAKKAEGPVTIYVPAGTYYISRGLPIRSNTTLLLDAGATMVATFAEGTMVYARHLDEDGNICGDDSSCEHGGYTQIENVTIDGGTWDRNNGNNLTDVAAGEGIIFKIRHGKNITIRNMVCKNAAGHFMNLSANDTVTVENVQFLEHAAYVGTDDQFWGSHSVGDNGRYTSIEALHLDYAGGGETSAYPKDGTPVKNVTIQGCEFRNLYAGLGTHHRATNAHGSNITIQNNTFTNIVANCINAYDYDNLNINGNTVINARKIAYVLGGASCTLQNNSITNTTGIAVHIESSTTVNVANNTVIGAQKRGISVTGSAKCNITGNTVSNCVGMGIYVQGSASLPSQATVRDNNSCSTQGTERDILLGTYCWGSYVENNHIGVRGLKVENTSTYLLNNTFEPHDPTVLAWTQRVAPTAVSTGLEYGTCDICGEETTRVVEKLPATMKLSVAEIPLKVNQSYKVEVSNLAFGDGIKEWRTNKPNVAEVNKKGKITGKKAGTAKITVVLNSGLKQKITVKVQKTPVLTTKIKLNYKEYTLEPGGRFKLLASVKPVTSKQKITFRSSNKKVVKVSASGSVKAVASGSAMVYITSGNKTVRCKVTVI